jgi:hypothetical protein
MSFSALRDVFIGRSDADYCVRSIIFLKSEVNAKNYLRNVHEVAFTSGDSYKDERWGSYPAVRRQQTTPIKTKDLNDSEFMGKQARRLYFDVSRFVEFLDGYMKADEAIKPIMLHYSMIYLLDFFSRTWLKYGRNPGHGIKLKEEEHEHCVEIRDCGIFPRAVDTFYFVGQSSLFSMDDKGGFPNIANLSDEIVFEKIDKMRYSELPKIKFSHLLKIYENLEKRASHDIIWRASPILVGYVILFAISSISRYDAEVWFKMREDRALRNKLDLLQYDFVYDWTPCILMETILKKGLETRLGNPNR